VLVTALGSWEKTVPRGHNIRPLLGREVVIIIIIINMLMPAYQ